MVKRITTKITDDELRAIVAENSVNLNKLSTELSASVNRLEMAIEASIERSRKESDASIEKSRKESEASIEKSRKESEASIEKSRKETEASFERSRREVDASIKKMTDAFAEFAKDVGGRVDDYGNRLGKIIEMTVIPGVRPALKKLGRDFDEVAANIKVKRPNGKKAAEIDVFLNNGKEAMAVEIKTHLESSGVDQLLKTLKTLREYENGIGIAGKKLYGAVAGIDISDYARRYARKQGVYIIEILEDENRLKAIAPPPEMVKTW